MATLLHAGADANKGFLYRALTPAADELKIARALLAGRANSSAECRLCGDTPLLVAADTGQLAATQLLLSAAANVETETQMAPRPFLRLLEKAISTSRSCCCRPARTRTKLTRSPGQLLSSWLLSVASMTWLSCSGEADRDKGRMMTPLFLAAQRGDLEMVHILLDTGISTSSGSGASRPKRARYS